MGDGNIVPLLQIYKAQEGDRYLLCSDGLSAVLTEKEIKALLKKSDKEVAIKALVDATYIQGAPDNITLVIADLTHQQVSANELLGAAL